MSRFLMTHSLLASWIYTMAENPYEDATTEADPMGDFMKTLRREPTTTTEAMQNGIDFENLVTQIIQGDPAALRGDDNWFSAANEVAGIIRGGVLQYKAKKQITVDGTDLLLYGRADALLAGTIYDIKFTKNYDRGKYLDSTQHPTYFEIIPAASRFVYLASNGSSVWRETYRRDEAPSIIPVISDFFGWLEIVGLMDTYRGAWDAL